jgi:hypothetical protein
MHLFKIFFGLRRQALRAGKACDMHGGVDNLFFKETCTTTRPPPHEFDVTKTSEPIRDTLDCNENK